MIAKKPVLRIQRRMAKYEPNELRLKEKPAAWSELGTCDIDGHAARASERERMSQFVEKGAEVYFKA